LYEAIQNIFGQLVPGLETAGKAFIGFETPSCPLMFFGGTNYEDR